MTAAAAPDLARLPQLRGSWVLAYRLLWAALAIASGGLLVASFLHPAGHPAILALRAIKSAVLIGVSAILLRRRRNDPVAALLALAFLTWAVTSSFDFASAKSLPMLLDRARFLLFTLALLLFPDGRWLPRWTRGVAVASTAVMLLGLGEGLGLIPTSLFLPLAIACVVAAVTALVARFRTAPTETVRQQLKWVALGLVAGIGLILCARAGAAAGSASTALHATPILWEALFQLGIVIVALGFLVSLLRYRLFDAETAITRSAAYAMLTIALVATFAGTEAAIEWFGQQYLGTSIGNLAAAVAAAVAAATLGPLHHRISGWAEHRFQRDLVELKTALPELLADLSTWASLTELGRAAVERIGTAVHSAQLALVVDGEIVAADGPFGRSADLCPTAVDLALPAGMSGRIILGRRPDGTPQARDELEALMAVVPALSRAVSTAARRDRQRRVDRRFKRAVAARLAALSARVARSS
jgi:hypothetical protein